MAKTVTLRLDDETYELLLEAARADKRALSNLIESAALRHIQEQQFVDDAEMAEIMANAGLMKRLRKGLKEAKLGKGRLVG
jgi:uncharacterized protein (DUF1778 family)